MKIRSVKPEFFTDPTMAKLSAHARLLYIGLWCYVDDEGRGEWLPKAIDGALFPHEAVDINALLAQLVRTARIVRYSDGNREFFYLPTFERYQKPNRKYDSKLPSPEDCRHISTDTAGTLFEQRVSTADAHAGEGEGEGEGDTSTTYSRTIEPKQNGKATDHVWEGFEDVFGPCGGPGGRKARNTAVAEVAQALAQETDRTHQEVRSDPTSRPEIASRAQAWPLHFPNATLTAAALAKHWVQLGRPALRASPDQIKEHEDEISRQRRRADALAADLARAKGLPK